ncbi:MAG: acetylglutamate kinase [Bacteroidota bacterium]
MEKINIVKVGGNVIEEDEKLDAFLKGFVQLEGRKLLVHGGGKVATHLAGKLGVETEMVNGRRITSAEMLDIVVMSYGGLINKKIVSRLQSHGVNGVGFTGADGNLILADKRPVTNGIDYGWVGDPKNVNEELLKKFLEENVVPVVAPITHDGEGNLLNTNADTIASELAIALSSQYKVALNFCFELKGVMKDIHDPLSLVKDMTKQDYDQLKENGSISDGMIPKLDNAFNSIERGVSFVRILKYDDLIHLEDEHEYTLIH